MKGKKMLQKLLKQTRGMVGIEAAIVLIAFVIVAAAFSFMVVNMGLFSTQRGRETIQQGVSESSSPLTIDGSVHIYCSNPSNVSGIVVPLKTMGVRYVPMNSPETEIGIRIENKTAYADIYEGIDAAVDPTGSSLDALWTATTAGRAALFIGNSDADSSLDYNEKGYLVVSVTAGEEVLEREHVFVEIRPETGAPISLEFIVPPQLTEGWHTIGS